MLLFYTFCCDIKRFSKVTLSRTLLLLLNSIHKHIPLYKIYCFTNFKKDLVKAIPTKYNIEYRDYYDNQEIKLYDDKWLNLSFNKINIYKDLFDEFKKDFIWIDLDTIICYDISYINDLSNVFIENGGNSLKENVLFTNNNLITIPRKNYIQGNFWKLNINLYNKLICTLNKIIKQNLLLRYDLQDLFNYYVYIENNLNDINIIGKNLKTDVICGLTIWSKEGTTHANEEGLNQLYFENNTLKSKLYPNKNIHILSFTFFTLNKLYNCDKFKEIVNYTDRKIFQTEKILNNTGLFWQYPVITEKTFYEQNKNDEDFLGFPWATCIDKNIKINDIYRLILQVKQNIEYYTCCQHIHFRKYINLFKLLGITTVYIPHKIKGEDEINGVKLMPCPLYAVNIEDDTRNNEFKNINFLEIDRPILYSFMGGHQTGYLTDIRPNIFNIKHNDNAKVINTGGWHFNSTVYSNKQNKNGELNIDEKHIKNKTNYNELLLNSKYSLCPSGTGPNSIRFWESLACGSIPILLADTLELPYNIDWNNAIIQIKESEIFNIHKILEKITVDRENELRKNCINIYNKLKSNFKNKKVKHTCKKI